MSRYLGIALGFVLCVFVVSVAYAAEDVTGAVEGTVKKTDAAAKTVVVKSADGTEHTFHVVDRTTVHGAEASGKGAEETFHGVKEGSHVVVHYRTKGTEDTAEEIDHVGKGGMKAVDGTVKGIDRGTKTIAVKTADGTEETFKLTDHAAKDAGKGVGEGAEKTGKVTVYYTEQGGQKVAHFFKKVF